MQETPVPQAFLTYTLSIGNGEVDSSILSGSTIPYRRRRSHALSVETEPDKLPRPFGRGRRLLVARHSRARFMREIRARMMACEHAGRNGHDHDVKCEHTANPFP